MKSFLSGLMLVLLVSCDTQGNNSLGTWSVAIPTFGYVRRYVIDLDAGRAGFELVQDGVVTRRETAFVDGGMRRDSLYFRTVGFGGAAPRDVVFEGRIVGNTAEGEMCIFYTTCDDVVLERK